MNIHIELYMRGRENGFMKKGSFPVPHSISVEKVAYEPEINDRPNAYSKTFNRVSKLG